MTSPNPLPVRTSEDDDHYACDPAECPDAARADDGDDHYACDPDDCPDAVQDGGA